MMNRILLLGLLSLLFATNCTDTTADPSTGSESHWLRCSTDDECPSDQECVDRRCTPESTESPDVAGGTVDGGDNASSCTDQWGRCSGAGSDYECQCTYYDQTRTSRGTSCDRSLRTCDPMANTCGGWQGFCDPATDPEPGVRCQCTSGEEVFRSYAELGHDNCDTALVEVCGEDVPPPGYSCEESDETVTKSCEVRGKAEEGGDGALQFTCNCSVDCPGENGETTATLVADTCEQALSRVCPTDC